MASNCAAIAKAAPEGSESEKMRKVHRHEASLSWHRLATLPTAQLRHRGNGSTWALAAAAAEPGVAAVPLLHGELTLAALHEPVSWDAHAAGIDPWEVKEMSQPSQRQPQQPQEEVKHVQPPQQPQQASVAIDSVGPAALGSVPQITHRTALLDAKAAEPTTRPRVYNPSAAQLLVLRGLSLGMLLALTILVSIGTERRKGVSRLRRRALRSRVGRIAVSIR